MLKFSLVLCVAAIALFMVRVNAVLNEREKTSVTAGISMSATSAVLMFLFINMQKASGNPDVGMEFLQYYLPISVFAFFIGAGILLTTTALIAAWKRRRRDIERK
ncbi:MAG TPA: hypothetical protein VN446_09400 [Candidatus Acidoferrum sp.]|nr:hypothetical protein [Candidatus Acidoferrum sp.]